MSILFDIGATKTRIAYFGEGESFEEPIVYATPGSYEEILDKFIETAKTAAAGRGIKKICGGMSRSIPQLSQSQFQKSLEEAFGAEVHIENDAAMAGLGEAAYGAGRGFDIVAYMTVSTGVGGARIVEGRIDEHAIGFEPGKQIMNTETGETLEGMISGRALAQRTGKHPKELTDPAIWEEEARKLAFGIHNIIVEWSPECLVLGGSMITGEPAIPLDKTEEYLKNILKIFPTTPVIKKAGLGDFGGLYGAMSFVIKGSEVRS